MLVATAGCGAAATAGCGAGAVVRAPATMVPPVAAVMVVAGGAGWTVAGACRRNMTTYIFHEPNGFIESHRPCELTVLYHLCLPTWQYMTAHKQCSGADKVLTDAETCVVPLHCQGLLVVALIPYVYVYVAMVLYVCVAMPCKLMSCYI